MDARRPDAVLAARPGSPDHAAEFRALSRAILAAAAHGTSRAAFARVVLEIVSRHAGASRAALRLCSGGVISTYESDAGPPARFEARHAPAPAAWPEVPAGWRSRLDPDGAFTTRLGSVWLGDERARTFAAGPGSEVPPHASGFAAGPGARSVAWIPLAVAESTISALRLEREVGEFDRESVRVYEATAQILAVALEGQQSRWALGERIKELGCLYEIARIAADRDAGLEETLRRIASTLPPAWQYREVATARITIDGGEFVSEGFREGPHRIAASVAADGARRGSVEVFYTEDVPRGEDGSPFLREEGTLLGAVAREVGLRLERFRVDDERVRLEEQLRHADRLATIGQLAAGVAHEINEPLGSVLGFAQLAMKTAALPNSAASDLDKIVRASLHAREVVRKLVLFARRDPPRKAPVRLDGVVREALSLVEPRCAKAGIEIVREDDADSLKIVADAAQLRQVVVNLAVNAVQAMPDGGRLSVRTRRDGNQAVLEVEDDGAGMTAEVLDRIFAPFFTTKDVGEGTGLGLPVAHGIVSSHGGTIDATSRPGGGSRFVVRLPVDGEGAAP